MTELIILQSTLKWKPVQCHYEYGMMYLFPWTWPQNNSKQQAPADRTARHDAQKQRDMMCSGKLLSYQNMLITEE